MTDANATLQELNKTLEAMKARVSDTADAEQADLLEAIGMLLSSIIELDKRVKDINILGSAIQNRAAGRPALRLV